MLIWSLGCSPAPPPPAASEALSEPASEPRIAPEPEPEPVRVTLAAVGDVLPHRRVKTSAQRSGWLHVFGDAVPLLQGADLAFANLESPIAPDHHIGIHDEVFNAPADLAPALAEAGIDVVSMANNHAFDQGPAGLAETWTRVRSAGLDAIGAGPDCATARGAVVREVRGVRVAFLAATDLANIDGNAAPDAPCLAVAGPVCPRASGTCGPDRDAVQFSHDTAALFAAVAEARARADFVVMSFHWGIEYQITPLPEYPPLARDLAEAGVDVLLGHHPHVLQPIETLRTRDGRTAVVAYSLGNFVSNMAESYDVERHGAERGRTRDAVVLQVELALAPDGRKMVDVHPVPLWTDNRTDGIQVRTLESLSTPNNPLETLARIRRQQIALAVEGPLSAGSGDTD